MIYATNFRQVVVIAAEQRGISEYLFRKRIFQNDYRPSDRAGKIWLVGEESPIEYFITVSGVVRRQILEAAVAEYSLVSNIRGSDETLGRRDAVRGMMVRLGLYSDFVEKLGD